MHGEDKSLEGINIDLCIAKQLALPNSMTIHVPSLISKDIAIQLATLRWYKSMSNEYDLSYYLVIISSLG